jgi:hypothetical protein
MNQSCAAVGDSTSLEAAAPIPEAAPAAAPARDAFSPHAPVVHEEREACSGALSGFSDRSGEDGAERDA